MKVYAVFVKDQFGNRYIDSQWAVRISASDRVKDLDMVFEAFKSGHACWIVNLEVTDVAITKDVDAAQSTPQPQAIDSPDQGS